MSESQPVIVIDQQMGISAVLEQALVGTTAEIISVGDIGAARSIVDTMAPSVVLCSASLPGVPDAGIQCCVALRGAVPAETTLLICAHEVSDELIRAVMEAGAKGVVPWPVSVESLRFRMAPLLRQAARAAVPAQGTGGAVPTVSPPLQHGQPTPRTGGVSGGPSAPQQKVSPPVPLAATAAATDPAVEAQRVQKVQLAQQLLAKVLHNLKTSALLDVSELEDVPRIVLEITKSVCNQTAPKTPGPPATKTGAQVHAESEQPTTAPADGKQGAASSDAVTLDLDSVFGLKRS